MYVIDTDLLSVVQKGKSRDAVRIVERIEAVESEVFVTVISLEEQMRGWLGYIAHARSPQQEVEGYARLYELVDDYHLRRVLLFTPAAAVIVQSLRRAHRRLGALDLKIAAIAMEHDATV